MVGMMSKEHISQNMKFQTQDVCESIKISLNVDIKYKKNVDEEKRKENTNTRRPPFP